MTSVSTVGQCPSESPSHPWVKSHNFSHQRFHQDVMWQLGFSSGSAVKNLPPVQKKWIRSLGSRSSPGGENSNPLHILRSSLIAQLVKNPPAMRETQFDSWVGKIPWRRERPPTPVFWPGEFHGQSMGSQRIRHN